MSIRTKANDESYLCLDNRAGAGVPDEIMVALGFPAGAGKGLFEIATYTCNHCEQQFIKNPERTRPRGWCKHCDKYICDPCQARLTASGICKPFKRLIEEVQEAVDKGLPPESITSPTILLS